jgi:haloacetate dehalogenase
LALDHPDRVLRLSVLDIAPTLDMYNATDMAFAQAYYHWFHLTQPAPLPETMIAGNPVAYLHAKLGGWGSAGLGHIEPEALAEYIRCTTTEQIHAVCEDYRATLTLDFEMDKADHAAGRKITCPTLALWGSNSHVGRHFKPMAAWGEWCPDLRGWAIPTGHYPSEHRPDLVYPVFWEFFTGQEPAHHGEGT